MSTSKLKYEKEEFVRRGEAIYESQVREQVEKGNRGKIVAIDIETGAFEVAEDSLSAAEKLQARFPEAQAWFVRIGHRAVHKVGFAGSTEVQLF
ncbi:MAG: hypothetical protein AAFN40_13235 [Cyanobacteria bacterium J06560_6]